MFNKTINKKLSARYNLFHFQNISAKNNIDLFIIKPNAN